MFTEKNYPIKEENVENQTNKRHDSGTRKNFKDNSRKIDKGPNYQPPTQSQDQFKTAEGILDYKTKILQSAQATIKRFIYYQQETNNFGNIENFLFPAENETTSKADMINIYTNWRDFLMFYEKNESVLLYLANKYLPPEDDLIKLRRPRILAEMKNCLIGILDFLTGCDLKENYWSKYSKRQKIYNMIFKKQDIEHLDYGIKRRGNNYVFEKKIMKKLYQMDTIESDRVHLIKIWNKLNIDELKKLNP